MQNSEGHALQGHSLPSKVAKIECTGGTYVPSKLSKKGYRLSQGGYAQVAKVSHAPIVEVGHTQAGQVRHVPVAQVRHAPVAQVHHAQSSSGNYDFLHTL